MPVACFALPAHPASNRPGPTTLPKPKSTPTSRRRGSVAVAQGAYRDNRTPPPPQRLNVRRCSLGRIFIDPEDEALKIFEKYQPSGSIARRLKKDEAVDMLVKEFKLDENEAGLMFAAFDKDSNDVMSLWEFRQFYQTVGYRAQTTMEMFKALEKDGSGKIDIEQTFDRLREVDSAKGKLTDEEIEMFLRTTAGEEKEIDFSKFLNMMCRINVFRGSD